MPRVTNEAGLTIGYECWFCADHALLKKKEYVCRKCDQQDKDAWLDYKAVGRSERKKRQLKEFTQKFDRSLTEAAGSILSRLKKITTRELVEMMEACGLGDDFRVAEMANENKKKNDFQTWAYHRAIGLMKALKKAGKCHIGTATKPGHPYVFYLDRKSEDDDLQGIITEYIEGAS